MEEKPPQLSLLRKKIQQKKSLKASSALASAGSSMNPPPSNLGSGRSSSQTSKGCPSFDKEKMDNAVKAGAKKQRIPNEEGGARTLARRMQGRCRVSDPEYKEQQNAILLSNGKDEPPQPHDEIKVGVAGGLAGPGARKNDDEKEMTEEEMRIMHEMLARPKTKIVWECNTCQKQCIPIRAESRCLCGHRYKEHPAEWKRPPGPRGKDAVKPANFTPFACTSRNCACSHFFYIVAEGAWVLRCRCKHKHTDHDPAAGPHPCRKPRCECEVFDSPWVCNCDHPWGDHAQRVLTNHSTSVVSDDLGGVTNFDDMANVKRTDLIAEPLHLR